MIDVRQHGEQARYRVILPLVGGPQVAAQRWEHARRYREDQQAQTGQSKEGHVPVVSGQ